MNKRGQALVEFIMIIPVFILLVLGTIEIGNILYQKLDLENKLDYVVDLYNSNSNYVAYSNSNDINVNIENKNNYTVIIVSKNIKINAPVIRNIFGSTYKLETERSILNEK